jgi:hypothetical protein
MSERVTAAINTLRVWDVVNCDAESLVGGFSGHHESCFFVWDVPPANHVFSINSIQTGETSRTFS